MMIWRLLTQRLGWVFLGLLIGSCVEPNTAVERSATPTAAESAYADRAPSNSIKAVWDYIFQLEERLALLACGPELKYILDSIRAECKARASQAQTQVAARSSAPQTGATKAPELTTCPVEEVEPAIKTLEKDLDQRFMNIVWVLRHEVVYLKDSSSRIIGFREERLMRMLREPLLKQTRFLIVVSPHQGEADAENRAKTIIDWLIKHNVPAERIDRPWPYALAPRPKDLKPFERPIKPEISDLRLGVWVFRTEC